MARSLTSAPRAPGSDGTGSNQAATSMSARHRPSHRVTAVIFKVAAAGGGTELVVEDGAHEREAQLGLHVTQRAAVALHQLVDDHLGHEHARRRREAHPLELAAQVLRSRRAGERVVDVLSASAPLLGPGLERRARHLRRGRRAAGGKEGVVDAGEQAVQVGALLRVQPAEACRERGLPAASRRAARQKPGDVRDVVAGSADETQRGGSAGQGSDAHGVPLPLAPGMTGRSRRREERSGSRWDDHADLLDLLSEFCVTGR